MVDPEKCPRPPPRPPLHVLGSPRFSQAWPGQGARSRTRFSIAVPFSHSYFDTTYPGPAGTCRPAQAIRPIIPSHSVELLRAGAPCHPVFVERCLRLVDDGVVRAIRPMTAGPRSAPVVLWARCGLVLALSLAAAVLLPLRRAQRALAMHSSQPGLTSAPRPSLRRRPVRPSTLPRPETRPERELTRTDGVLPFTTIARPAPRALSASPWRGPLPEKQPALRNSPTVPAHLATRCACGRVTDDEGDRMVHGIDGVPPSQQSIPAAPAWRLVAETQVHEDTPHPPPRH